MQKGQITRKELAVQIHEERYECGTYLHYRGCNGLELHKIVDKEDGNVFYIAEVSVPDFNVKDEKRRISIEHLRQYYKPVTVPMEKLHELSQRLIDGETVEDLGLDGSDETGTELMFLGDKRTLVALRSEVVAMEKTVAQIHRHAKCIVDSLNRDLMKRIDKMNGIMRQMNTQIERLDYVIQTIETYAGIKEDIVTVRTGIPGDEDVPVVIRQAVIYMDEEMALIDPEFDWQKIKSFDEWLVKDDNYKTLLPDIKSIVAIKPRRYDKKYSNGETVADRWYNWTMNQNNHVTLFLIRNGENVYRIESEHIVLNDRLFPNADEYLDILRKEQEEERRGWHSR